MILSGKRLCKEPRFYLKNKLLENVDHLDILGVQYDAGNKKHVVARSDKCRRSFYSMRDMGMAYPGCSTEVKSYLWNSMCQPTLLYGCETVNFSSHSLHQMETLQGNLLKQSLGLSKRSRSTCLLSAIGVQKVEDRIKCMCASLLRRIYCIDTPVRSLTNHFLSLYLSKGILVPGTIVQRIVSYSLSPIDCIFNKYYLPADAPCGITDSLKVLLQHEHFIKPYSEEHLLCSLITRSF
jgi:hypothetical protein